MSLLHIQAGRFAFTARFEEAAALQTCARFRELLPFTNKVIHSRWSGEAVWVRSVQSLTRTCEKTSS